MTKAETLPLISSTSVRQRKSSPWHKLFVTSILCLSAWYYCYHDSARYNGHGELDSSKALCPQVESIFPSKTNSKLQELVDYMKTSKFRNESVMRLSGAVQVPTQSFDDLGPVEEDPRWKIFYRFEDYLRQTFPRTHERLQLEKVNAHGLLYTWAGSNATLKPTVLMAHQDVVPVPESTVSAWTHPPFSGFNDGKFIWGRGSSDCKNTLMAILGSIESLLSAGYVPRRTVILSFGFDEESSGQQGAAQLSKFLLGRYGKDSVAVIVDEGSGVGTQWGTTFAMPGTAEKGYIDVRVIVRMPGGHSSIPPSHTGIGVISELIALIEQHPYSPHLVEDNPYLKMMQCGAAHAPDFPKRLKKLLPTSTKSLSKQKKKLDKLAKEASKESLAIKYLMTTSVAVDVINGGVKVNALPERTEAIVNHRINVGQSDDQVKDNLIRLAKIIAHKHNLTVHAFEDDAAESPRSITLTARKTQIPTSPVTPTEIHPSSAYSILSGTTRALYGKNITVSPGIMTGNTDTRYYWDLSPNIFRYVPGWDPESEGFGNIHTVDEKVSIKAHIHNIQWFTLFIRNMDEAKLP